jgi:hypothetical protein
MRGDHCSKVIRFRLFRIPSDSSAFAPKRLATRPREWHRRGHIDAKRTENSVVLHPDGSIPLRNYLGMFSGFSGE